jgi:predicted nucleotidyltransferase
LAWWGSTYCYRKGKEAIIQNINAFKRKIAENFMKTHYDVLEITRKSLQRIKGISKIILYGSVMRNEAKIKSDIDLAIIFDDFFKMFPLDSLSDLPFEMHKITKVSKKIEKKYKIKLDISQYWESQYEEGITFTKRKKSHSGEKLKEIGKVIYESNIYS